MNKLRTWLDELGHAPPGEYDHTMWVFPLACVLCAVVAYLSYGRMCEKTPNAVPPTTKFVFLCSFTLAAWAMAFSVARWLMFAVSPN